MSGELVPNSSPPTTNPGRCLQIVSIEDEDGNMRDTIKLSSNAEKSPLLVRNRFGASPPKKRKIRRDYITFADTDVTQMDNIYMFHPTYTYINKTIENFDARPPSSYFRKRKTGL